MYAYALHTLDRWRQALGNNNTDDVESGTCCSHIIHHGIDLLSAFNESVDERGECSICLSGFGADGTNDNSANAAGGSTRSDGLREAATCSECRSMFHGACLAEHLWRLNVRATKKNPTEDFYFDIGKNVVGCDEQVG